MDIITGRAPPSHETPSVPRSARAPAHGKPHRARIRRRENGDNHAQTKITKLVKLGLEGGLRFGRVVGHKNHFLPKPLLQAPQPIT